MVRPRWHDFVIAVAVAGLLVTGVLAIWGDDIEAWFGDDRADSQEPAAPDRSAGSSSGTGA